MHGEIQLVAECYANACFAEELKKKLRYARVVHKKTYGRERILRVLSNKKELAIGIIDYEEGIGRVYIEKQSEVIERITEDLLICKGVDKLKGKLLLVFDPRIEKFLIRRAKWLNSRNYQERIKSRMACDVLSKVLTSDEIMKIVDKVVDSLNKLLGEE